jgi:spermidine synthase
LPAVQQASRKKHARRASRAARHAVAAPGPAPRRAADPALTGLLLLFLFLSGAVALVYQSLWTRKLSLVMGSTTYAIGTVLAAFMAGLGGGAYLFGARSDRSTQPLRLYAWLELAIGAAGLVSPLLLAQGNGLYARAYLLFHEQPALLTFARFGIGFLFVAVPAALMGGTLPVAARYVVRAAGTVGHGVARLYAINTLGACAGVLLLPFVLLPALGIRATLVACGLVNLGIGAAAWRAARGAPPLASAGQAPAAVPRARGEEGAPRGLLAAFFLSGFVALALETVWNRFFGIYFGSSIYAYAVVLFVYLGGIVLGSALYARVARRGWDPEHVFALCLFLLVADLALTVPLMDRILYVHLAVFDAAGEGFATFQLASALAALLVILPPTLLFGISFPAVTAAASRGVARVGQDLGRVYLVNTAGTAAGALAGSFLLIPRLGVRGSLDALTALGVGALALALAGGAWRTRWGRGALATAAALAALPLVLPGWDLRLLHLSLGRDATLVLDLWRRGRLPETIAALKLREVRDGVDATVAVADTGMSLALYVNGKIDASDGDMFTQLTLGHVPLLVHPAARDVLVIGMGSGVTAAAVARYPVERIDLVEISPEVLDLGARHFSHLNRDVVRDPRLRVHLEDGRNFIAFDRRRAYDVIISEPSNPWMTGVSNLFTDEFFVAARARLRPGGVLSQWFHMYSMELEDIRVLVGTLRRHFAHVYGFAFLQGPGDMQLLASDDPLDFSRLVAAGRGHGPAAGDLSELEVESPVHVIAGLVLSPENVDRFVGGAPVNSDDRPRIELRAPRALFEDTSIRNQFALLHAAAGARLPVSQTAAGLEGALYEPTTFELSPPDGFAVTFSGYRMESADPPGWTGEPSRELFRTLVLEDGDGRRIDVLSGGSAVEPSELERLAALAAGAEVAAHGEGIVSGHPAAVFAAAARTVVAWSCEATDAAHAVALPTEEAPQAEAMLAGLRCRHP